MKVWLGTPPQWRGAFGEHDFVLMWCGRKDKAWEVYSRTERLPDRLPRWIDGGLVVWDEKP